MHTPPNDNSLPSPQTGAPALVDPLVLESITGYLPPDSVDSMIEVLCDELVERDQSIRQAVREHNHDVLEMQSHTLKSVAGQYGAKQLQALATQVNDACKQQDFERAEQLTSALHDLNARTVAVFRGYQAGDKP